MKYKIHGNQNYKYTYGRVVIHLWQFKCEQLSSETDGKITEIRFLATKNIYKQLKLPLILVRKILIKLKIKEYLENIGTL